LGDLLATVVALEIDRIERFASAAKLAAYAGLVRLPIPRAARPSTAS
jgi:transposase